MGLDRADDSFQGRPSSRGAGAARQWRADANAAKELGKTALMMASEEGHLDVAQALLANGADVNAAGTNSAALLVAAERGHLTERSPDLVRALLSKYADVNVKATLVRPR
jgi:uncharacterized protein